MSVPPTIAPKITVRRARVGDVNAIYACQRAAYPEIPIEGLCDQRVLRMQLKAFPDGQAVAELDGKIVGYCASLIVSLDDESPWYSYGEITGSGTFTTHTPGGDTLYGADIGVHPDFRRQGVARELYAWRGKITRRFNLKRMVAGGRIPGYRRHAGSMTAEDYVAKVVAGELEDPALSAHLRVGYRVRGVHMGYLRDARSLDYATFLELENPDYRAKRRRIAAGTIRRPVRKIRVCAAQYEVRRIGSWAEFATQVEFFVSTADTYHCHFLLFPELFTAQLFSTMDPTCPADETIRKLAGYTGQYIELFSRLARETGIFIIAGSHPVEREGHIYNSAFLFTPSGAHYTQDKLHVTPPERDDYGIHAGSGVRIFDTGLARIAIQVCYDIEFPEVARALTLAGAEVIFVPFSTDERKAYLRVRYCAQARAVENMIYVAMAGNVGNLPQVQSFLINYGQAAVLTPSDFAFPPSGIAGVADFNSETVVITDLDLSALENQRELGSVRPLRDRRTDLYDVQLKCPIETIHTQ